MALDYGECKLARDENEMHDQAVVLAVLSLDGLVVCTAFAQRTDRKQLVGRLERLVALMDAWFLSAEILFCQFLGLCWMWMEHPHCDLVHLGRILWMLETEVRINGGHGNVCME